MCASSYSSHPQTSLINHRTVVHRGLDYGKVFLIQSLSIRLSMRGSERISLVSYTGIERQQAPEFSLVPGLAQRMEPQQGQASNAGAVKRVIPVGAWPELGATGPVRRLRLPGQSRAWVWREMENWEGPDIFVSPNLGRKGQNHLSRQTPLPGIPTALALGWPVACRHLGSVQCGLPVPSLCWA